MADTFEGAKLLVSVLALGGTVIAAGVGLRTFWRTEQWKRAEFLAREMKDFFSNRQVALALQMIDWDSRRLTLLGDADPNKTVRVSRADQLRALLPHPLLGTDDLCGTSPTESDDQESACGAYSPEQAAIRDCYDAFLDGLERFASYVSSGLIEVSDLRAYLTYWIDDIHAPAENADDAAWSAAILAYIEFYRFRGVQALFLAFERDIRPSQPCFTEFLRRMTDQDLAVKFANLTKQSYAQSLDGVVVQSGQESNGEAEAFALQR